MNEAEKIKTRVTSLVFHLKYASQGLTDSIYVVQAADLPVKEDIAEKTEEAPVIQTPKLYLSLTEVPPPYISENNPFHQATIQAPNRSVKELEYEQSRLGGHLRQFKPKNGRGTTYRTNKGAEEEEVIDQEEEGSRIMDATYVVSRHIGPENVRNTSNYKYQNIAPHSNKHQTTALHKMTKAEVSMTTTEAGGLRDVKEEQDFQT
ncbi:hypothetical protein NQZ68_031295 [Dissostichus eleginoides]|nr:hypothetical protein NQZ68_031295 [Dissostichus eleginoides]